MTPDTAHRIASPKWESAAWKQILGLWTPLYGNFFTDGCSLEWHDFHLCKDLQWSQSFHPQSLEICLNFSGNAHFTEGNSQFALGANQLAIYATGNHQIAAHRTADSIHRFVTVEVSSDFLSRQFAESLGGLIPEVRLFTANPSQSWLQIQSLPFRLLNLRLSLLQPPVHSSAASLWYQSKTLEILSQTVFQPDNANELFCDGYKRVNQERIARVIYLIERDYANPPSLDMLAKEVECSPFHLSRLFARQMGMSIPRFLRTKRIEKAAALLKEGRFNVSEVASSVGYASLSAFTKAFVEQIGCCPGLYAHLRPELIRGAAGKRQFRAR